MQLNTFVFPYSQYHQSDGTWALSPHLGSTNRTWYFFFKHVHSLLCFHCNLGIFPDFLLAEFVCPDPADSHLGQNPLFFCLYLYWMPHTKWRYTESRLLPAVWDEEALGNLLPEVIVFSSSSTFLQITSIVKLLMTEDSHLPRPRRGSLPLYRIWWTEGWLWLALMSCRVNFRAGERKLQRPLRTAGDFTADCLI